MLLTEYDEQAHIESEKKIAREEGENLLASLVECLERDGRLQDLKLLTDKKSREQLYREYNLSD